MHNASIKNKVVVLILIILVPLVSLHILAITEQYKNSIESEMRSSQDLADAISTSFLNYIDAIWSEQLAIGLLYSSHLYQDIDFIESYMQEIVYREQTVLGYTLADAMGNVIACTREGFVGKSIRDREYFKHILQGQEKVISNIVEVNNGDIAVLPVARAIYKDGQLIGVVAGVISLDKLYRMMPSERLGEGNHFAIVDGNGIMFYHSQYGGSGFDRNDIPQHSHIRQALKGEVVKIYHEKSSLHGGFEMGIAYPISEFGWVCIVTSSVDSILGKHIEVAKRDVTTLIIVSILSIAAAIKFGSNISNPILALKDAATKITQGDLTARTNLDFSNFKTKDEVATTAEAFDYMANHIEKQDYFKNQFFATISHELKTPLNIILGSIQLIKIMDKEAVSSNNMQPLSKYTGIMQQNCYRLLRLINNLIDITKLDAQFLNLKVRDVDIVKIVEDITLSVAQYVESSDKTLIFDTDVEEKIIACDADKVERIMLNLLSNALKYTEEKGKIEVTLQDQGEYMAISVKDDGIGIPLDQQELIFHRFKQVDEVLTRKKEGSGIGLSLVKGLVESHGGKILLKSRYGHGSEFTVLLPATRVGLDTQSPMLLDDEEQVNIERIKIEFSDIYS